MPSSSQRCPRPNPRDLRRVKEHRDFAHVTRFRVSRRTDYPGLPEAAPARSQGSLQKHQVPEWGQERPGAADTGDGRKGTPAEERRPPSRPRKQKGSPPRLGRDPADKGLTFRLPTAGMARGKAVRLEASTLTFICYSRKLIKALFQSKALFQ